MTLQWLRQDFSVCQVNHYKDVDMEGICFLAKTDEENSLVCETGRVPPHAIRREDGWKAFRIVGVLDFSLVGVLAGIAAVLAAAGIPLFALSTYNTDYIMVKNSEGAERALSASGYEWTIGENEQ